MISLTKDEFINYMNFIYEQNDKQEQFVKALESLCPGNYCDCWLFNEYTEKYLELLKKLMNDKNDDILYFLYELEQGQSKFFENIPYNNEEELYDYLVHQDNEE